MKIGEDACREVRQHGRREGCEFAMSHCCVSLILGKLASVDGWRRRPTKTASRPEPQIPKCSESTTLSSPLPDTPSSLSALPARVYQSKLRITTINQDMLGAVVQSHHPSRQVQSQDHRRPRSVAVRVTRAWPATWERGAWKDWKAAGRGWVDATAGWEDGGGVCSSDG